MAARFVYENYASLEEDTAKGYGKHIRAMLSMMDCDKTAQPAIANSIRTDFSTSMREPSYASQTTLDKAEAYYNLVSNKVSGEYTQACKAL
ncbi:MAG: DUF3015 family protein [Gammaproteobacteria bacterium]|nr:DUF3015 family protein [Gammaproteobacteria bacterium]